MCLSMVCKANGSVVTSCRTRVSGTLRFITKFLIKIYSLNVLVLCFKADTILFVLNKLCGLIIIS